MKKPTRKKYVWQDVGERCLRFDERDLKMLLNVPAGPRIKLIIESLCAKHWAPIGMPYQVTVRLALVSTA